MPSELPKKETLLLKYCVIYIRVSDEKQAEKVSPQEQERDCREYAEKKGYIVVEIYRDIEPYKGANGKRKQCAAYHSDRPGFLRMIADAKAGKFGTIIAWREDRLYRGVNKALLDFSSLVTEYHMNVELIKDYYDIKTAPVKAWAAGVELEAKHDRTNMGVKAKLAAGKSWYVCEIYGYRFNKETDSYCIDDEEARGVRFIYKWYSEGLSYAEIANRLNSMGIKRSKSKLKKYEEWYPTLLHKYITKDFYWTGILKIKWDDEEFEVPIPTIVDYEDGKKAQARRTNYKINPNGATKYPTLLQGLLYCHACNCHMNLVTTTDKTKNGPKKYGVYRCNQNTEHRDIKNPGCIKYAGSKLIDDTAWNKLWNFISDEESLQKAIAEMVAKIQSQERVSESEMIDVEENLKNLVLERQEVISLRRKKIISEEDLTTQLMILTEQEVSLKRHFAEIKVASQYQSKKLIDLIKLFAEQVNIGYKNINLPPRNDAEKAMQFKIKKQIVQTFVKRVDLMPDRTVEIHTEINFSKPLDVKENVEDLSIILPSARWSYYDTTADLIPIEGTIFDSYTLKAVI
jgi:site-specific DNA recombinase